MFLRSSEKMPFSARKRENGIMWKAMSMLDSLYAEKNPR
jgi:hypothetical protein